MAYTPSAGTRPAPAEQRRARPGTATAGWCTDAADGTLRQGDEVITDSAPPGPCTGLSTQSQSYADRARRRASSTRSPRHAEHAADEPRPRRAFREATGKALREVFLPGRDSRARSLVRNRTSARTAARCSGTRARRRGRPEPQPAAAAPLRGSRSPAIAHAGEICKQLITAMSADEFRSICSACRTCSSRS